MNRRAHRELERRAPRPLCKPGTHSYQDWQAAGQTVRVVCTACGRTFQQVMVQSPGDLEIYRQWLAIEVTKAEHAHPTNPAAAQYEFVNGCPGCERVKALLSEPVSQLAVRTAVKQARDGRN